MICSIVLKKITNISFTKIEMDTVTGKTKLQCVSYSVKSEEIVKQVEEKHRVLLPCKIVDNIATFYIPIEWDEDVVENYMQALLDELYLHVNKLSGCKSKEQIEASFALEVVIL